MATSKSSRTIKLLRKDWQKFREALEMHNRQTGKWPKIWIDPRTKDVKLRLGYREQAVVWVLARA